MDRRLGAAEVAARQRPADPARQAEHTTACGVATTHRIGCKPSSSSLTPPAGKTTARSPRHRQRPQPGCCWTTGGRPRYRPTHPQGCRGRRRRAAGRGRAARPDHAGLADPVAPLQPCSPPSSCTASATGCPPTSSCCSGPDTPSPATRPTPPLTTGAGSTCPHTTPTGPNRPPAGSRRRCGGTPSPPPSPTTPTQRWFGRCLPCPGQERQHPRLDHHRRRPPPPHHHPRRTDRPTHPLPDRQRHMGRNPGRAGTADDRTPATPTAHRLSGLTNGR